MANAYHNKNDNLSLTIQPNVEQRTLLKEYGIYCARYLEFAPVLHEQDEVQNFKFLIKHKFLKIENLSASRYVDITPLGQSLLRAMGIKLETKLARPDTRQIAKQYL